MSDQHERYAELGVTPDLEARIKNANGAARGC